MCANVQKYTVWKAVKFGGVLLSHCWFQFKIYEQLSTRLRHRTDTITNIYNSPKSTLIIHMEQEFLAKNLTQIPHWVSTLQYCILPKHTRSGILLAGLDGFPKMKGVSPSRKPRQKGRWPLKMFLRQPHLPPSIIRAESFPPFSSLSGCVIKCLWRGVLKGLYRQAPIALCTATCKHNT